MPIIRDDTRGGLTKGGYKAKHTPEPVREKPTLPVIPAPPKLPSLPKTKPVAMTAYEKRIAALHNRSRLMPGKAPTKAQQRKSVQQGYEAAVDKTLRETQFGLDVYQTPHVNPWVSAIAEGLSPVSRHTASDPLSGSGVIDALALIPGIRGPRAIMRATKAVKEGESALEAARIARASLKEAGPVSQAARRAKAARAARKVGAVTDANAKMQTRLYYHNILRGAHGDVLKRIPAQPKFEHLVGAFNEAINKGDFRSASIIQDEVEHLLSPGRGIGIGPTAGAKHQPIRSRTSTLGKLEVQFPESPSPITAYGQRLLDRASEHLTGKVNALRESESAIARGTGKALTPFSSRARVPKMAGKRVRQEAKRKKASVAEEFRALRGIGHRLPFIHDEGAQAAHTLYAQLPKEYRNPEGLKLVRAKLDEERKRLASLEAELKPDASGRLRSSSRAVPKSLIADAPARIADISETINKLDRIIEKPVTHDPHIHDALRKLDEQATDALVRAGALDPEQAAERRGIVGRWLGLQPSGDEAYIPHQMGKVRGPRETILPAGVSMGRTALPEGVGSRNEMKLLPSGRARLSLEVAIEHWQKAMTYEFHNISKDVLGQAGEPFNGRLKEGYYLLNPKGHAIPRHFKVDREAKAIEEGFDPEDIVVKDVDEYLHNYLAETPAQASAMVAKAAEAGHLEDLRQVPADVVHRYYGQFLTPRPGKDVTGISAGLTAVGKGVDTLNNALYASLIYANPGYIPANTVANLVMAGVHQGAFLPINLIRTGQVLTRAPRKLRDLMRSEVGHGPTVSLTSGKGVTQKLAKTVGSIADDPLRMSALIHEMARKGLIAKSKPWLSKEDFKMIERVLTEERYRPILNDAQDAATQAMVDFERLGPMERAYAKRLLFVWAWIRGATRYPARFALDHPARSALLAYVAAGEPGAPDRLKVNKPLPDYVEEGMPPWLEGALSMGDVTINGKTYPQVLPTRSISPISTPWDLLGTAIDRPGAQTFAELLNPGLSSAFHILAKQDPYGGDVPSYGEAVKGAIKRDVPLKGLAEDLIHPSGKGIYPGDATRLGRIERALRIFPIAVDPEEAYKARKRLGMEGDREEVAVKDFLLDSKHAGMGDPPPQAVEDLRWKTRLDHKIRKDADDGDHLDYQKAYEITAELYDARYGTKFSSMEFSTQGAAEQAYHQLRAHLYPFYAQWDRQVERVLSQRLASQEAG